MNLILTERDRKIIAEISRWRFLLSRQVRLLCGFSGQRACDRRIRKLISAGYIERRRFIYGIPSLLFVTRKAVRQFNLKYFTKNVRIEQIEHDVNVVDTAIYMIYKDNIDSTGIITERDLRHTAGYGNQKHVPDFVYTKDEKNYCVEAELSIKKMATLEKNMQTNYKRYDVQQWIVPHEKSKLLANVRDIGQKYDIEIINLEGVMKYVRAI